MKATHSVLIVWSWWAGLRCAIELREQWMKDILIVWDRAFIDPHTTQARGWINAALKTMDPEDSEIIHAVDTFREGQFVAHPHLAEALADSAPEAINDLLRRWAQFHREDDGRLTQRFFWAHSYRRTVFAGDETGKEMVRVMTNRAKELGIPYLEGVYVYDLIKEEDRVVWICTIGIESDEKHQFFGDAVVLATWWYSNVYWRSSSRSRENFGDGIGLAYRAWAKIGDIELIQFHPTWLLYPEEKFGELVTEAVRGEWGILRNSKGERFMSKYDPEKMELSTRDVVARANFHEIHEGRGTERGGVYLDISHRSKAYILERLPKMHSMILKYNNVDISEDPVEVAPTTHYTMWGIRFDPMTMKTSLSGLRAAWECTMWVHGANRLWGNSLMETMVFGKKVAQALLINASIHVENESRDDGTASSIAWGILTSPTWLDAHKTLTAVRKKMDTLAGIVRNEEELQELVSYIDDISTQVEERWIKPVWSEAETIIAYRRLQTVLQLSSQIALWAIERNESRGAHYRKDALDMDAQFDKNFLHQLKEGKPITSRSDLPQPSSRLQEGLEQFERTKNYGHSE